MFVLLTHRMKHTVKKLTFNMKKTFINLLSVVTLLSSCTDDGLLENALSEHSQNGQVCVTFAPFVSGDNASTRSTISCGDSDEGKFSIGDWDPEFDMIGLANVSDDKIDSDYMLYGYSVDWETEDDGISFTFSNPEDQQMLDKKSWYKIIYPFVSENTYENERGVTSGMYFYFNNQKQNADNSTEHLSDFVFYHSSQFQWKEDEPVNVAMKSECSILKMELTLPKGTYKGITIENVYGDLVFDKYIKYDLPSGWAEHSRYTAYGYNLESDPNNFASPSMTLELNQRNFSFKTETTCTFYISVGASSIGCFRIKALTNKGKSYYTKIFSPITLQYGKYYTIRDKCVSSKCPEAREAGELNGYEWVDLGLKSHVKWAKINVGTDEHHKTGNYYAWGETVGHEDKIDGYGTWTGEKNPNYKEAETKSSFNYTDYKWCNGQNEVNLKYQPLRSLEKNDDVAYVKWGKGWRMPTSGEIYDLFAECEHKFVHSYNGTNVSGMIFYKKQGSPDGPHIFLPASGYKNDGEKGSFSGYYWTSERGHDQDASAYYFSDPDIEGYNIVWGFKYYYGFNVRPVCEAFE